MRRARGCCAGGACCAARGRAGGAACCGCAWRLCCGTAGAPCECCCADGEHAACGHQRRCQRLVAAPGGDIAGGVQRMGCALVAGGIDVCLHFVSDIGCCFDFHFAGLDDCGCDVVARGAGRQQQRGRWVGRGRGCGCCGAVRQRQCCGACAACCAHRRCACVWRQPAAGVACCCGCAQRRVRGAACACCCCVCACCGSWRAAGAACREF